MLLQAASEMAENAAASDGVTLFFLAMMTTSVFGQFNSGSEVKP
jgi:hypothetical protein